MLGNEGFFAQCGAADRGAVDGVVDAYLVIHTGFAQRLVLDFIEVRILTEQLEEFALPAIVERAADILDRFDRIVLQNEIQRLAVIRVD